MKDVRRGDSPRHRPRYAAAAARRTRSSSAAPTRSETEKVVIPHGPSPRRTTATTLGAANEDAALGESVDADGVTEDRLTGGRNTAEVVRIRDTVRRSRGAGASFAAQVLAVLESVGYPYSPRHLGIDDHDRDVLSYIPGRTTDHPSQRRRDAYAVGGRMLRELHDATSGHVLAADQECVIHGDPGPFNTIFRDGRPVAFIDWDSCRPGKRPEDLAYMAWTWCIQSAGHVPVGQQAVRLRRLRDGYGCAETDSLLDMMTVRQSQIVEREAANARNSVLHPVRRRHAEEAIVWATNDRDLLRRCRPIFLKELLR